MFNIYFEEEFNFLLFEIIVVILFQKTRKNIFFLFYLFIQYICTRLLLSAPILHPDPKQKCFRAMLLS